jgi:hypothetical protein
MIKRKGKAHVEKRVKKPIQNKPMSRAKESKML